MDDTAKYLIHAAITADGVVERSDVVGAIFGQTEGLLGDELDLRDLQQSSKVGRIDVQIDSENGQSFGRVTIATSLDKVETAILAASLETITRVGPCQADARVTDIEDVREAKRREVVERAKELLAESFDDTVMTSTEILEEVRESVRVEDITEYEGLPAGPRVVDSDAIIVVEGRADVLTLLKYGIKNAVAVEGTNVPEDVAELTQERTVTAFLDGDRGGELILRELSQVGDVDYVAFAPEGKSVEDLPRHEVMSVLRNKIAFEMLPDDGNFRDAATDSAADAGGGVTDPPQGSPTTESATPAPETGSDDSERDEESAPDDAADETPAEAPSEDGPPAEGGGETPDVAVNVADAETGESAALVATTARNASPADVDETRSVSSANRNAKRSGDAADAGSGTARNGAATTDAAAAAPESPSDSSGEGGEAAVEGDEASHPPSLRDHVRAVVGDASGTVRLLDDELRTVSEAPAEDAFDAVESAESAPYAVVLDDELSQRVLDVAAQRGVSHAVAASTGEFVKRPVGVRVLAASDLLAVAE
ncbi:DNA primase DnaG [Halopelagius longus]|uniref:DNA primase DnaG n=1 Tax=Halopelagius longus TaxID=1236180 RepID=A0A1H0Y9G5_9EURY|nr:DNA primase DnaG [Halopelagius longus]RDI72346.1 DNA primase [Halopelagius longus]SDQ11536.1 Toprim domain-containing protein [Halopelagius longus]